MQRKRKVSIVNEVDFERNLLLQRSVGEEDRRCRRESKWEAFIGY
jgi:hypothetical protein